MWKVVRWLSWFLSDRVKTTHLLSWPPSLFSSLTHTGPDTQGACVATCTTQGPYTAKPHLVRLRWLESHSVFVNSFHQPNFIHELGEACGFFPLFLFRLFFTSSRSSSSTLFEFLSPIPTLSGPIHK